MRTTRATVAVALALGSCLVIGGSTVAAPPATASRIPVTITASALDVDRLVYQGTVSVPTAAGTVPALELEITGATFRGLTLNLPCVPTRVGGLTGRTSVGGTASAPTVTVYATEVLATIDGSRVRLSSSDPAYPPPPDGTTLVSDGTLVDPTIVSVLTSSQTLQAANLRTSASFCTPGSGPALTGGTPLGESPTEEPTPSDEPTTPSSEPTGEAPGDEPSTSPSETPSPSVGPSEAPSPSGDPSPSAPADPTTSPTP